jgi:hypothetical protein
VVVQAAEQATQDQSQASVQTDAAPASSAAPPAEQPRLASLEDALEKAVPQAKAQEQGGAASTGKGGDQGDGNPASKAPAPSSQGKQPADASRPDSTEKPAEKAQDSDEDDDEQQQEPPKGQEPQQQQRYTRRGAVKRIEELEQEVQTLRAKTPEIPPEVMTQVETYRLSDAEFSALEEKLKREDLTGQKLTQQEREKYNVALTFRSWFAPVYAHAQGQVDAWAQAQRQSIFDDQAKALAPVLRDNPYITTDKIANAASWEAIYRHIAESAVAHGRSEEKAEWQPKLAQAQERIEDLEAQLAGLRPVATARASRPLERGGSPTAASEAGSGVNLRTASAGAIFDEAFRRAERKGRAS